MSTTTLWFKFLQLMLCTKKKPIDGGINTSILLYIYKKKQRIEKHDLISYSSLAFCCDL